MIKVLIGDLNPEARGQRAKAVKLRSRRVRGADGKFQIRYMLDITDPDFNDQFLKVFQLNVARARRKKPPAQPAIAEAST